MLTQKQERFVLNLFQGLSQRDAYVKAGYSSNQLPATIDRHAAELAKTDKIQARLSDLNGKAESKAIMSVSERKERLSEIARARLTDYQETGLDSGYINIGKESPNTGAIASIKSATKFDENGNTGTLFTEVRLHNPVAAIQELNKMDGVYDDTAKLNVNVDNRKIEIIVASENARQLTDRILLGETPIKVESQ
jgi:phage terminase small subunit